jgi:hypothetical protein
LVKIPACLYQYYYGVISIYSLQDKNDVYLGCLQSFALLKLFVMAISYNI